MPSEANVDVGVEKRRNSFITAILPGGILHQAFIARYPFNAVLVPSETRLQELQLTAILSSITPVDDEEDKNQQPAPPPATGLTSKQLADQFISHTSVPEVRIRNFLASLVDNHLARFDDFGLGEAFTLCSGIRGTVSEGLDKLSISGRLTRITIAAHVPPASSSHTSSRGPFAGVVGASTNDLTTTGFTNNNTTRMTEASRLAYLDCLNIFLLNDCVIESYDVRRVMLTAGGQQVSNALLLSATTTGDGRANLYNETTSAEQQTTTKDAAHDDDVPVLQVSTKPSGGISKILGGLMSSWRGGSTAPQEEPIVSPKSATEHSPSTPPPQGLHPSPSPPPKSNPQANFKEFQTIMQRPESKHLARCLTAFVDYCNNATCVASRTSSSGSASGIATLGGGGGGSSASFSSVPGASPANKPVSPNEVRSVIDQLVKIIHTMQQNGEAGGDLWRGKEEEVALEGFEKYIMTKIYNRTFAFYSKEREEGAMLHIRIAALRGVVSEHTFEIVPPVKFKLMEDTHARITEEEMKQLVPADGIGLCSTTPHWAKAVEELRAMSTYKCPRDKLMCGINACKLVVKALDVASLQAMNERKRLEELEKQFRQDPPPAPSHRTPDRRNSGEDDVDDNEKEEHKKRKDAPPAATADTFLPALFLLLSRANPSDYLSNMRFVDRYRHRTFLDGDAGYLLTCLLSAIDFWQNCGHDELGISVDVYETAVAKALPPGGNTTTTQAPPLLGSVMTVAFSRTTPLPPTTSTDGIAASSPPHNVVHTPYSVARTASSTFGDNAAAIGEPLLSQKVSNIKPVAAYSALSSSQHMDPFDDFFASGQTTVTQSTQRPPPQQQQQQHQQPAPREDDGMVIAASRTSYPPYDPNDASHQQGSHTTSSYPPIPGHGANPATAQQQQAHRVASVAPSSGNDNNRDINQEVVVKGAINKMIGRDGFETLSVAELRALADEALRLRRLLDLD